MNNSEIMAAVHQFVDATQEETALRKADYWKKLGTSILGPELSGTWIQFVDARVASEFDRGSYIDEILHILSLIKMGKDPKDISEIAREIPDIDILLLHEFPRFVQPEILDAIKSNIEARTA